MIVSSWNGIEDDEGRGNYGPNDDRNYCLPPRQAQRNHGAPNHIRRDIGICQDPFALVSIATLYESLVLHTQVMEGPEIPCSAVFLDGSDIVVNPSVGHNPALMRNFKFFN